MQRAKYIDTIILYKDNYKDDKDYFNDINNIIKSLINNNYHIRIEPLADGIDIQYCYNGYVELAFVTED